MTSGELVETPQFVAVSLLLSALIRLVFVASNRATLRRQHKSRTQEALEPVSCEHNKIYAALYERTLLLHLACSAEHGGIHKQIDDRPQSFFCTAQHNRWPKHHVCACHSLPNGDVMLCTL